MNFLKKSVNVHMTTAVILSSKDAKKSVSHVKENPKIFYILINSDEIFCECLPTMKAVDKKPEIIFCMA